METLIDKRWFKVFDRLEHDKERLLTQRLTIDGKKMVFRKDEIVFFMGRMRCILSDAGWRFEV